MVEGNTETFCSEITQNPHLKTSNFQQPLSSFCLGIWNNWEVQSRLILKNPNLQHFCEMGKIGKQSLLVNIYKLQFSISLMNWGNSGSTAMIQYFRIPIFHLFVNWEKFGSTTIGQYLKIPIFHLLVNWENL